jgi:hypothetical protein
MIFTLQNLFSQRITGIVVDEDKKPLEFVSVALLQPQDSLLVKYTSTDAKGAFEISSLKEAPYILQVFLMTYQTNQRTIIVSEKDINLDTIHLQREVNELNEVVISAVIPIKIKKDTIAFNTKAFKVKQDDNVGDLIKKLPGIEVEADGTVNAQGQVITKILVDGKEFFNSDPQIALQNLSADAIESIEIIDESSDDARVSGVRDGQKYKVINLVLKEGKKFGFFGKAGAGYGTNDRYSANLDVNSFTDKSQFAVFGNLNNINNSGASIFNRDGSKGTSKNGYLTTGIIGTNYNYEIKEDFNFNVDYYYNYTENDRATQTNRTEFSNHGDFESEINDVSKNISNNHNLNFSLRDRSNKGAYLLVRGNFKNDDRTADGVNKTTYFDEGGAEDTSSDRINHSEDKRKNGNMTVSYRKKLDDNGRNFRWNSKISFNNYFDQDYQISNNEYGLSTPEHYYKSTELTTRDYNNDGVVYNFSFRYQEPIVKNHYISFTSLVNNEDRTVDLIQDKIINEAPSDPYIYDQDYFRETYDNMLGYNFSVEKFHASIAGNYDIKKQQLIVDDEVLVEKKYKNLLPKASFSYNYKKGNYVRFLFNRSLRLPSLFQLSPVINDFNPLRVSMGNPDLTPSKVDNINLRFYTHSFRSANSFFANVKYTKTNNAVINWRYFGANRIRYSTYENYGSKYNVSTSMHFSRKISNPGIRYGLRFGGSMYDRTSKIGEVYNTATTKRGSLGVRFSNINKNIFDLMIGGNISISNTSYSTDKETAKNLEQVYYAKYDWDITNSLNFNSQFKYTLISDSNFDSQAIPIWNMAVEYVFMNQKRGLLKFQVIDVLDEDVGVRITSTTDYYEETYSNNLGTYAMLSFTYSLKPRNSKKNKKKFKKK